MPGQCSGIVSPLRLRWVKSISRAGSRRATLSEQLFNAVQNQFTKFWGNILTVLISEYKDFLRGGETKRCFMTDKAAGKTQNQGGKNVLQSPVTDPTSEQQLPTNHPLVHRRKADRYRTVLDTSVLPAVAEVHARKRRQPPGLVRNNKKNGIIYAEPAGLPRIEPWDPPPPV